ncbi:MAG: TetR family transcriptional regulator, partial [Actinomycetales bacterium]|nr:TetR family transcriptional regulator [Actinomycetales bacterium]
DRKRALILRAAVEVLSSHGWSGMTFAAVARASGLSPTPILARFPSRGFLAAAAWDEIAGPALHASLSEVLAAAGLAEGNANAPLVAQAAWPLLLRDLHGRLSAALSAAGLAPEALVSASDASEGTLSSLGGADALARLGAGVSAALEAAGELDAIAVRAGGPSPTWLTRALEPFVRPGEELRAASELLVMSQFDSALQESVQADIGQMVAAWCAPAQKQPLDRPKGEGSQVARVMGQRTAIAAARRTYLVACALGLLFATERAGVAALELAGEAELLMAAFASRLQPGAMPRSRGDHLETSLHFDTGDQPLDALLRATLEEVARVGYDAATTSGIGRAAGYTEGLIFARYPSKVELFADASARQTAKGWRENEAFAKRINERCAPGMADAVLMREIMRPDLRHVRAASLEHLRLARHDDRLREVLWGELDKLVADEQAADPDWERGTSAAHLHMSVALGLGVTALPLLAPDAWQLPFQHVTIPLSDPSIAIDGSDNG